MCSQLQHRVWPIHRPILGEVPVWLQHPKFTPSGLQKAWLHIGNDTTPKSSAEVLQSFPRSHTALKVLMENVNQSAPVESRATHKYWATKSLFHFGPTSENFAIKTRVACGIVRVAKQTAEYNDTNIQVIFFRNKGIKMGLYFSKFWF